MSFELDSASLLVGFLIGFVASAVVSLVAVEAVFRRK